MRNFLTFLSFFTLLFFFAPLLCLNGRENPPDLPAATAPKPISFPETVSCNGEAIPTGEFLVQMLGAWKIQAYRADALKAAAVAAASQLTVALEEGRAEDLPRITPDGAKRAWGDYWFSVYWPKLQAAVRDTYGTVLTRDGAPFPAEVFPLSWGKTEEGVDCPYDFTCGEYVTTVTVDLEKFLPYFPDCKDNLSVKNAPSGRVETVTSGGSSFTGTQLMSMFSLPSPAFTLSVGERVVFTCRGQGDGRGMSLYAANEAAKRGDDWETILRTFYPQAEISRQEENRSLGS